MTFTLAIIGRPNVGKSTLFNRLVGKKLALVDDRPGVTRDRREGEARLADLRFTIIDTAGLEEGASATLEGRMRAQTEAAIESADAILFMIDARVGVTPDDKYFADLVRRAGKKVVLAANKSEGKKGEAGLVESYELGLGDPVPLSAEHGEGLGELYDALLEALPEATQPPDEDEEATTDVEISADEDGSEADPTKPLRIAVVGRPNAGKSTLINRLLGEDRLLTGPEAGITRDSIGVEFRWRDREMKLFDTAGLRKRARVVDKLEKLAGADALRAVRFSEVVVLLLDSAIPFEKQDLTIADLAAREGRAVVIALGKWDAVDDPGTRLAKLREEAERLLPQIRGCPVVPVSGATGYGLEGLMRAVLEAHEVWNRRISTARLNRWLESAIDETPPPAVSGRRIKIRYMTQAKARPPYFILFGNQLEELPASYMRFLTNGLRKAFALPGTPIRISVRSGENPFDRGKK
ncbi:MULTISPECIES: ribosome biogenesis GTPase Der [Methylosinus]|uniref:GTPase Der n=1 Tax=Methylosinus trichosporium (strain ATCC 35070 / NCIMB 11131 / UNIQEM 75 / OB3b) TaxID=595536 RepID=A0A2D2CXW9_METT3|nr:MULTISPECIES: ribosome biogenesis GTPase Der [Methylosinus]ATQ67590.1 ribosome biogenesis GTPase Der [Methylosinus trichosporium OB3b]OBS52132.1 ribosome biogenesis GTPase Der [Methylosinus sp. 3S-1]